MHELATTQNIVKIVIKNAETNHVKKVIGVTIVAGAIRNFNEEWLQRYYDIFSHDTIAEGAKITLNKVPIRYHCNNCNSDYEMSLDDWIEKDKYNCQMCGSSDTKLVCGREFSVEGIEAIM